jgi:hypothetical protein
MAGGELRCKAMHLEKAMGLDRMEQSVLGGISSSSWRAAWDE